MRLRHIQYSLILLLNAFIVSAQNIPYSFPSEKSVSQLMINRWTVEDGLPSQGLRNFIQAQNGYIWITSYDGLIRFDGFDFKVFNSKNTEAFKENICSYIIEDKNNTLWFISRNRLMYYKNGEIKEFHMPASFGEISGPLHVDTKNRLWLSSDKHGIFYIKEKKPVLFDNLAVTGSDISSITEDKSGNIYFGVGRNKIIKFDGKNFLNLIELNKNNRWFIEFLHFYNNKLFWINNKKELFCFDGFLIKKEILFKDKRYFSVKVDRQGNRWFSTEKGVYKQDAKSGKIEQILHNTNNFSLDVIDETLVDYEGNLWLRLNRKGLIELRYGKFSSISTLNGLHGKICNTVCEDKNGVIFLGFDNGAVDKIDNNKIYEFLSTSKTRNTRVRHIAKDSYDNFWISTYSGLLKIYPSGKQHWFNRNSGFPTNTTRLTFEDSNKNIWLGTKSRGIIKINKDNSFQTFPKLSILQEHQVLSINEDNEGRIMIGTSGIGLVVLKNNEIIKIYNRDNQLNTDVVFNTYIDTDSVLWVVTNGGGLNRIDGNKSTFYTMKNGLANDSPFDIVEDNLGNFWMPFAKGVMLANKKQLNDYANGNIDTFYCEVFDKYDGIKSLGFTPAGHSIKASDGKIWFPSFDGVQIINHASMGSNNLQPPVHIEEFKVDGEPLKLTDQLIIEPGKQRFSFKFTAICLQSPEKVQFKYKLIGFNKDWIETNSENRLVSYTNLKYGEYTFNVIASNNDGVWNKTGASISFKVKPFFYETIWFIILSIIILAGLIFMLYKIRIAKIKRNEEKLKSIVTERTAKITLQKHEIEAQHDEISAINEDLIQQKTELENHKNHLEDIVNKRTAELERSKMKAEEADKLKTAFLNNMSHEIRTPMNGILGFLQLLAEYNLDEKQREEYIKVIAKSTNQLLSIVDEIIYISKIEAGVEKLKQNQVNLSYLLSNLYKHYNPIAKSKKLNIICLSITQAVQINTDFAKLNQILTILIDNALKFTKKGEVEFGYKQKDGFLQFFVKDTGIGIDPTMHHKIFHQFRQVDDTDTKEYGGLGLGLSISKAYVELLGGKIWLESEINKGTTFYFTIPYQASEN